MVGVQGWWRSKKLLGSNGGGRYRGVGAEGGGFRGVDDKSIACRHII